MRIAIYGAGSLGTILGAYISKAGVNIELINRNKTHIEALQTNGAQVTGTVQFTQPVKAYTPNEMSGQYDIIFLMTKQQHNTEVVTMLKDYLAPDGVLVTDPVAERGGYMCKFLIDSTAASQVAARRQ